MTSTSQPNDVLEGFMADEQLDIEVPRTPTYDDVLLGDPMLSSAATSDTDSDSDDDAPAFNWRATPVACPGSKTAST